MSFTTVNTIKLEDDFVIEISRQNPDHKCQAYMCKEHGYYIGIAGGEGYHYSLLGVFCKRHIKMLFNNKIVVN